MAQEHPLENIFSKRATLAVLLLMLLYIVIAIGGNIVEYRTYQKELATHNATIDQLSQDNLQLSDLLTYLKSDEAVDSYARTQLGYKKEGERAFIITQESIETTARVDDIQQEEEKNAFRWYRYYFSN